MAHRLCACATGTIRYSLKRWIADGSDRERLAALAGAGTLAEQEGLLLREQVLEDKE